jgi:hypothetical protein
MNVTNEDLVFLESNHQSHRPIFRDDAGVEYVPTPDGQTFVRVDSLDLSNSRRETVVRK